MPVVHTYCSAPISDGAREVLKAAYGKAIEAVPGKSEAWLMCLFEDDAHIYFAGDDSEPCALVDVSVFARSEVPASAWERFTEATLHSLRLDPELWLERGKLLMGEKNLDDAARLAAYDEFAAGVRDELESTKARMDELAAAGKVKTATYRQLFAARITLKEIDSRLRELGL